MTRNDPNEAEGDGDPDLESLDRPPSRDQDPVSSLRDVEAEAGDEEQIADLFDEDDREARELGALLNDRDEPEPGLE